MKCAGSSSDNLFLAGNGVAKKTRRPSLWIQYGSVVAGTFVMTMLAVLVSFGSVLNSPGYDSFPKPYNSGPQSASDMIVVVDGSKKYHRDYKLGQVKNWETNRMRPVPTGIPHRVDTTKACSLSIAPSVESISVREFMARNSTRIAPGANDVCIRAQSCRCRKFFNPLASCGDLKSVLEGEKLYMAREDLSSMAYWDGQGPMSKYVENRSETNRMPEVEKIGQYIRWEHRHGVGVICERTKLLYLKNHKGGSNSVRRVLEHFFPDCEMEETFLGNLKAEQMKDYVIFTTVREPMERFFSQRMQLTRGGLPGVADYSSISLEKYIDAIHRGIGIKDRHQRSFGWYMTSAFGLERVPLRIDYVVRVEHIVDDLNYLLRDALHFIPQDRTVAEVAETHSYLGAYKTTEAVNFDELKDPKARQQLCDILAMDYECAGYSPPQGCR